jgi:hypothetical protein
MKFLGSKLRPARTADTSAIRVVPNVKVTTEVQHCTSLWVSMTCYGKALLYFILLCEMVTAKAEFSVTGLSYCGIKNIANSVGTCRRLYLETSSGKDQKRNKNFIRYGDLLFVCMWAGPEDGLKWTSRKSIYKVVQIWPGQTVTCLHTNSPGHIWTTLYLENGDKRPASKKDFRLNFKCRVFDCQSVCCVQ